MMNRIVVEKFEDAAALVLRRVKNGTAKRILIVSPTNNFSSLLATELCKQSEGFAEYHVAHQRVVFKNGAKAFLYTAAFPERMRGFNSDLAWVHYVHDLWPYRDHFQVVDQVNTCNRLGAADFIMSRN